MVLQLVLGLTSLGVGIYFFRLDFGYLGVDRPAKDREFKRLAGLKIKYLWASQFLLAFVFLLSWFLGV
jgi:hypothetical protein